MQIITRVKNLSIVIGVFLFDYLAMKLWVIHKTKACKFRKVFYEVVCSEI